MKIKDIQVGTGSFTSWRRRLTAEIEPRYADDGTTIYKGPLVTYFGYNGVIPDDLPDRFMLEYIDQTGIQLEINGMAVGGKRRITIDKALVCPGTSSNAPPMLDATCSEPSVILLMKRRFVRLRWLSRPL